MKADLQPGWRIRRLATGSGLVRRRTIRAFVPLADDGEIRLLAASVRCGAGLWLGWSLLGLVHQSPVLWIAAGSAWWCRAAWKAATGVRPATAPEETPAAEDDGEWIATEPPPAVVLDLIREVAALSDQGTAAHLQQLLEVGQQRGHFGGWTLADLKDHLVELRLTVVDGKKLTFDGRQRNRQAVLLPEPAPVALQKAA